MGYVYLAGGSPGQITGDFQRGINGLSYFNVSFLPTQIQSTKGHLLSILMMISAYYTNEIVKFFKIAIVFPIALLYTAYQAVFRKTKADSFLGLGLILFIPIIPLQAYATIGYRQDLYLYIIVLILIAAMLDRIFNVLPVSKTITGILVLVATVCLVFLQVTGKIPNNLPAGPTTNQQTLGYFDEYSTTAAWIDANVQPDEKILTPLRDANILHILTAGNRTILDINTCIGAFSFVPAKSCTPPYIIFWVDKGTTDPDEPFDLMEGISETALISSIRQNDVKYVVVTPRIYYLYYYLKVNPDFEQVAHLNDNVIFRIIHPVQSISRYPDVKWETCVGKGTPEYLKNFYKTYPARFEASLRDQFEPWMGLSSQDMTTFMTWQGCEFESVYPGQYTLP